MVVEGEKVGVVFANTDAILEFRDELISVTIAGVDGTFKTVPRCPPDLKNGCLLTFHILLKNYVCYLIFQYRKILYYLLELGR